MRQKRSRSRAESWSDGLGGAGWEFRGRTVEGEVDNGEGHIAHERRDGASVHAAAMQRGEKKVSDTSYKI